MEALNGLGRRRNGWPMELLLAAGVLLTAGDLLLASLLIFTTPPVWLWSMLSLAPWGPIALVVWVLVDRHRRRVHRIRRTGVAGRATVRSIGGTSSVINGRPVLRLAVSVGVADRPTYQATVRNAPPSHLVGMLRPGVSLPVIADREAPARVIIDWATAERETSPDHDADSPQ